MAKHDERHLTTEQLSAYIDKELSQQEQANYRTHLQSCEQCRTALASLQQTVTLLHALPQPALPRSFALPTGVAYLQERHALPTPARQRVQRPLWQYYMQRSLRAASTIAAVIGLVFLLSSVLPYLHFGGGAASSTSNGGNTTTHTNAPYAPPKAMTTETPGTIRSQATSPEPVRTHAVAPTPTAVINSQHAVPVSPPEPLLDLSTVLGRQELGFALLILGIIGVILTRRWRRERRT